MEVQAEKRNVIEIDAHYYLMEVFNAINEQRSSVVFSYHGVRFWREEYQFATEQKDRKIFLGEIFDFDVFKNALGLHQ